MSAITMILIKSANPGLHEILNHFSGLNISAKLHALPHRPGTGQAAKNSLSGKLAGKLCRRRVGDFPLADLRDARDTSKVKQHRVFSRSVCIFLWCIFPMD